MHNLERGSSKVQRSSIVHYCWPVQSAEGNMMLATEVRNVLESYQNVQLTFDWFAGAGHKHSQAAGGGWYCTGRAVSGQSGHPSGFCPAVRGQAAMSDRKQAEIYV